VRKEQTIKKDKPRMGHSRANKDSVDFRKKLFAPSKCPECGSEKFDRSGLRYLKSGEPIQRFLCKRCGNRFSFGPKNSKTSQSNKNCECAQGFKSPPKNLQALTALKELETTSTLGAGATTKGHLLQFLFELQKEGLAETSIKTYETYLNMLMEAGANLNDVESVKETIAKKHWSMNTKAIAVTSYTRFLEFIGSSWKPPKIKRIRKLPFIPLEKEIDALISGARKKLATFLQLLKETGVRSGEAWNLKWIDIDFIAKTITLNEPEKYGKPRIMTISSMLVAMLKTLQTDNPRIFIGKLQYFRQAYRNYRKRLALKLNNTRLLRITFHTFRHWKATMEYHKTKDILHVKELLGHRDINTTLLYTQLVKFESSEYHTAIAKTVDQARKLGQAGYELFDIVKEVHIYRRRK